MERANIRPSTTKNDEPLIVSITGGASANDGATTVEDLPYVEGRQYYAFELEPGYNPSDPAGSKVTKNGATPGNYHHNMYDASDEHELKENGDCTSLPLPTRCGLPRSPQ